MDTRCRHRGFDCVCGMRKGGPSRQCTGRGNSPQCAAPPGQRGPCQCAQGVFRPSPRRSIHISSPWPAKMARQADTMIPWSCKLCGTRCQTTMIDVACKPARPSTQSNSLRIFLRLAFVLVLPVRFQNGKHAALVCTPARTQAKVRRQQCSLMPLQLVMAGFRTITHTVVDGLCLP